jgi:hypothetical protein
MADETGDKWKVVEVLLTSPNLILVLGAIFKVLGAAGGVTYKKWLTIEEDVWRLFTVIVGIVLIALYFLLLDKADKRITERAARSLGIKIDYPENNAVVMDTATEVRGTMAKPKPDGYELYILGRYASGFTPYARCSYSPDKKKWYVQQLKLSVEKGHNRTFEVWLVGPDGSLLLETWLAAHETQRATNSRLQELAPTEILTWLKPINKATSDMFSCDSIKLNKG